MPYNPSVKPKRKNKCIRTSEKYWLTYPVDLLTHATILPSKYMSLGAKLNSVVRLSLLIFIFLLALNFKYAYSFILFALAINCYFWIKYKHEYE